MKKRRKRKDAGAPTVRPDDASAPVTPLEWPLIERHRPFWGISLLLVGVMTSLMIYSARLETASMDEPVYLLAGYQYLTTGDFEYNSEHPPLAKLVAGLPLLPLGLHLPTEADLSQNPGAQHTELFLYQNRVPPEELLFYARLPFILLTAAFGLLVAWWTRRHFGALPSLVVLTFYSLDPNIIAHGRYAATDMVAVISFFLSCIAWTRFLRTKSYGDLLLAGLALGLAFGSKFSNLSLLGILPLLYLLRWWQVPGRYSIRHFVGSVMILVLVATAIVGVLYWPETVRAVTPGGMEKLDSAVNPDRPSGRLFQWLGQTFHLPAHSYLVGIYRLLRHDEAGHKAYLMGELDRDGWWYYFPVAFAVKTPAALLLGLAFAIGLGVYSILHGAWRQIRRLPFFWLVLTVPATVYFLITMMSNINIGLRHILLIYPFLFVLVAVVLVRRRAVTLMLVLAALLVFEHGRVAPHYLAFFNSLVGGPNHGAEYLVDSNLDWGQDLKKLKTYVESNQIENLCLAYFGPDDLGYYELDTAEVPTRMEYHGQDGTGCVAAVSASRLMGVVGRQTRTHWLRDLEPMDRVGYSIFIYDLRRRGSGSGSDRSRSTRPL